MEKDNIEELLAERELATQKLDAANLRLEQSRTPVTILFSDIKGSTAYYEEHGDVKGLAMVQHHNDLLFPKIAENGGRVVKTIGDAIMAAFLDPAGAIQAAVSMQRVLEADREKFPDEPIHIKVGLHTGLGLVKDDDVFGDVVNAAARVQHQAEPDQILITDVLLDAAKTLGIECAEMGRAQMKGKDEPIDLYAVAWSAASTSQLIEQIQAQFDKKLKEAKRQQVLLEEEFEQKSAEWRKHRKELTEEIIALETAVERAKESARNQVSEELQSEIRFQLQEAVRARQESEQESIAAQAKWETERNHLRSQIASMQGATLEAMERSNNPTRLALAVREQLEARLNSAKQDWELQWDGERRRLNAEIERLKKAGGPSVDPKKEAAKRALLERLGKIPAGTGGAGAKSAAEWEAEFSEAKLKWEAERDQLLLIVQKLERELQYAKDDLRAEVYEEVRGQYEPRLAEANRERLSLNAEMESLAQQMTAERQRTSTRIELLEQAVPAAQEAAKKQVMAELQADFDAKDEERNRRTSLAERKFQNDREDWEDAGRKLRKQIEQLKEELVEARETAYKARKNKPE